MNPENNIKLANWKEFAGSRIILEPLTFGKSFIFSWFHKTNNNCVNNCKSLIVWKLKIKFLIDLKIFFKFYVYKTVDFYFPV